MFRCQAQALSTWEITIREIDNFSLVCNSTYCQWKPPVMPSLRRSFNERWREGPGPVGNIACPAGMEGSMVGKADLPDPPSITSVDKADPAWRCGEAIFYSYRCCFTSHRRYFYFYLFLHFTTLYSNITEKRMTMHYFI